MGVKKASVFVVISVILFFLSGILSGYIARYLTQNGPFDHESAIGSALISAIVSVFSYFYWNGIAKILKKAFKALFD